MRLGDLDALSAFVSDLRSTLHKEQSTFKAMTQREFEIKDNMYLNFQYAIDNAPTVDFEKLGESLRCQIRAEYGGCDDCELSCPRNELIKLLGLARPHGEWGETEAVIEDDKCEEIKHVKVYYHIGCPNMGKYLKTTSSFCPNCGADMRKPNCVTCNHFGKCEGCEKGEEE